MTTPDGRSMESSELLRTAEALRAKDAEGKPVVGQSDVLQSTDDPNHPKPYRESGFANASNPPPERPIEDEFTD